MSCIADIAFKLLPIASRLLSSSIVFFDPQIVGLEARRYLISFRQPVSPAALATPRELDDLLHKLPGLIGTVKKHDARARRWFLFVAPVFFNVRKPEHAVGEIPAFFSLAELVADPRLVGAEKLG